MSFTNKYGYALEIVAVKAREVIKKLEYARETLTHGERQALNELELALSNLEEAL